MDTGVGFSWGDRLQFTATGTTTIDATAVDANGSGMLCKNATVGPDGWTTATAGGGRQCFDSGAPLPHVGAGALIGRFGSGPWFQVDTRRPMTVPDGSAGHLILGVNGRNSTSLTGSYQVKAVDRNAVYTGSASTSAYVNPISASTDAGRRFTDGQRVDITATGGFTSIGHESIDRVSGGTGTTADCAFLTRLDQTGHTPNGALCYSRSAVLPDAPLGTLVYRFGSWKSGAWLPVTSTITVGTAQGGELFLAVNGGDLRDKTGAIQTKINDPDQQAADQIKATRQERLDAINLGPNKIKVCNQGAYAARAVISYHVQSNPDSFDMATGTSVIGSFPIGQCRTATLPAGKIAAQVTLRRFTNYYLANYAFWEGDEGAYAGDKNDRVVATWLFAGTHANITLDMKGTTCDAYAVPTQTDNSNTVQFDNQLEGAQSCTASGESSFTIENTGSAAGFLRSALIYGSKIVSFLTNLFKA
ncbi:hypothetical protein ACFY15_17560 [Streptomyces sp. NPDC001373]|uniref:hypothetical protein n=1 Tax=Streptomyces sp. NPDC001373 TaxID=3364565 RepID=UPI003684688A